MGKLQRHVWQGKIMENLVDYRGREWRRLGTNHVATFEQGRRRRGTGHDLDG